MGLGFGVVFIFFLMVVAVGGGLVICGMSMRKGSSHKKIGTVFVTIGIIVVIVGIAAIVFVAWAMIRFMNEWSY